MGSNKIVLIITVMMMTASVQAQTFSEWFRQKKTQIAYYVEQLAALKAYNDLLVDGYSIVRDGLQVAHDIRKGEFDLHHDWFQSLRLVNGSFKTDQVRNLYDNIIRQCDAVSVVAEHLPDGQQPYVQRVLSAVKNRAREVYSEYELLTTEEEYQLADDERLRRINGTITALHEQYVFVKRFYYELQKLILQEKREDSDAKGLEKIYLP